MFGMDDLIDNTILENLLTSARAMKKELFGILSSLLLVGSASFYVMSIYVIQWCLNPQYWSVSGLKSSNGGPFFHVIFGFVSDMLWSRLLYRIARAKRYEKSEMILKGASRT